MSNRYLPLDVRFWKKVVKSDGCWDWAGMIDAKEGYGRFGYQGRTVSAHRVAYELTVGPIPAGLVIDHLCRNRRCVNPAHMQPVTDRENILRGIGPTAVNSAKTHCLRGHEFSASNTRIDRLGKRNCRACDRDSWRASHGTTAPRNDAKTHCLRGHELNAPNLFPRADGRRDCLQCRSIRQMRKKESTPNE